MKKLLILILLLFITGCDAEYTLKYEDNVFSDSIEVFDYYNPVDENSEDKDLSYFVNKKQYYDIDGLNPYKVNYEETSENYYDLKYTATFDKVSYEFSSVLNNCVQYHDFVEDEEKIYIMAYGEYYCEYFDELKISLITDKKVTYSNADEEKNGKHIWYFKPYESINIEFEIDKNEGNPKNYSFILYAVIMIVIVIVLSLIILGFKIYKKLKNNQEV